MKTGYKYVRAFDKPKKKTQQTCLIILTLLNRKEIIFPVNFILNGKLWKYLSLLREKRSLEKDLIIV